MEWDGMGGKVVGVREAPSAARNIQRSQWHSHALHPTSVSGSHGTPETAGRTKLQGGPRDTVYFNDINISHGMKKVEWTRMSTLQAYLSFQRT